MDDVTLQSSHSYRYIKSHFGFEKTNFNVPCGLRWNPDFVESKECNVLFEFVVPHVLHYLLYSFRENLLGHVLDHSSYGSIFNKMIGHAVLYTLTCVSNFLSLIVRDTHFDHFLDGGASRMFSLEFSIKSPWYKTFPSLILNEIRDICEKKLLGHPNSNNLFTMTLPSTDSASFLVKSVKTYYQYERHTYWSA